MKGLLQFYRFDQLLPCAKRYIFMFLLSGLSACLLAQTFPYDENLLIGTHWQYTQTIHAASRTVVHRSDRDAYSFWLQFNADNTFQLLLNGKLSRDKWSGTGYKLYFPFKELRDFTVADITQQTLVLEFEQGPVHARYQYVFKSVDPSQSKLPRSPNELPPVTVIGKRKPLLQKGWWANRHKPKDQGPALDPVFMQVELINGGYFGGIDPLVKDFISIKTDGRVIMEHETQNRGLTKVKKSIDREELELFMAWVEQQGFFDMKTVYDCENSACDIAKTRKPSPIPMRLALTYGSKRKVVTVSIWQPTPRDPRPVTYPPALDNIVEAIVRIANRPK